MVPRAILAIFLVVVVGIAAMCGRDRAPAPADTPVPTPTALPTTAATATQTATAVPMTSAPQGEAVLASTVEPTVESTEEPIEETTAESTVESSAEADDETRSSSVAIETTQGLTETEASAPISGTQTVTATVVASVEVTVTAVVSDTPAAVETVAATAEMTITPSETPTATVPPTNSPTATRTASPTRTPSPTASPTWTPTATATPSPSATAAPTNTATSTPTSIPTSTPTSTPTVEIVVRPRQAISLPTDLATSVAISRVTLLTDVVADVQPMAAELAPDGTRVAWLVPAQARRPAMLCVANIAGQGENCVSAPGHEGMPYRLVWSPDSKWLAFSEDAAAQALESDIWLWDVARGELQNRTDDGVMGRYAEAEADFALDYLPMWDVATGYLYFWRSTPLVAGSAADGFDLALMRLDPDRPGDPQVVRDFGQTLGAGMLRFGWQRFYLQGPAAISPDGLQMAVALAPAQEMDVASDPALWLIDLTDDEAAPTPLANSLAWQEALPQWSSQPAVVRGVQWTADGRGLVVAALSSDLRLPLLLAYYVDVASGEVTPVIDFGDSRDRDAFFRLDPNSGRAPRFDVPWTMALAPDANVLLLVTDLGGSMQVLGAALPPSGPPSGDAPRLLHVHRSPGYEVWTRSSAGGEFVLVYGMLMTLAPD